MRRITTTISFFTLFSLTAVAGEYDGAPTKGNLSVWRMNNDNAQVSLCSFEGKDTPPTCYPWSESMPKGNYRLLAGDDLLSTWRLDEATGAVSMCEYADVAQKPHCTPWSK